MTIMAAPSLLTPAAASVPSAPVPLLQLAESEKRKPTAMPAEPRRPAIPFSQLQQLAPAPPQDGSISALKIDLLLHKRSTDGRFFEDAPPPYSHFLQKPTIMAQQGLLYESIRLKLPSTGSMMAIGMGIIHAVPAIAVLCDEKTSDATIHAESGCPMA
jgi:hypothetical protein